MSMRGIQSDCNSKNKNKESDRDVLISSLRKHSKRVVVFPAFVFGFFRFWLSNSFVFWSRDIQMNADSAVTGTALAFV